VTNQIQTADDHRRWTTLLILAALSAPGLLAATTLGLDNLTRALFGSALTTWGFLGGLVGLTGLLSGYVSILAWPGVTWLSLKSLRSVRLSLLPRLLVVATCLVATYSAAFWLVWFVILPLRAAR
jgi:hypothetical protein